MIILKMKLAIHTIQLLALSIITLHANSQGNATKRPNFLFIFIDDLRTELGCYGSTRVKTPNIDSIANQSAVFKNAYCQAAVCGASRASILTGIRPIPNKRFKSWNTRADADAPSVKTFPEYLKNNGYHTISNGKLFHHQDDSPQSWSEPSWRPGNNREAGLHKYNDDNDWLSKESAALVKDKKAPFYEWADVPDSLYHDVQICDKTISDLRRLANTNTPFFIGCGFNRPHLPFNAPKKYWDLYNAQELTIADNRFFPVNAPKKLGTSKELLEQYTATEGFPNDEAFHRKAVHGYLACVSFIDAQVGKLMQELKTLGLLENTVVILLGDHGFSLGEHNFWGKHNTMNTALSVPLIIKSPHVKASIQNQNVELVDLYPSICNMATLTTPTHCVGKSITPLLLSPTRKHKKFVFAGYNDLIAVKYNNFLYTEWLSGNERMLFNHSNDPKENTNIAALPANKKVVKKLHNALAGIKATW
jgi:iduronate 2-sulfatase